MDKRRHPLRTSRPLINFIFDLYLIAAGNLMFLPQFRSIENQLVNDNESPAR